MCQKHDKLLFVLNNPFLTDVGTMTALQCEAVEITDVATIKDCPRNGYDCIASLISPECTQQVEVLRESIPKQRTSLCQIMTSLAQADMETVRTKEESNYYPQTDKFKTNLDRTLVLNFPIS